MTTTPTPVFEELKARRDAARAEAERLDRMMQHAPCSEVGHRWESTGGRNAGCADWCCCSVPVNECAVCGDCDYGQNDDAVEVRRP